MTRGESRRAAAVLLSASVVALAAAGCGSSSNDGTSSTGSPSSSGDSGSGGGSGDKARVAIVLTRPENSAFGQPATEAATEIRERFGNEVTVQGGLTQANVASTLSGYASHGYGLVLVDGAEMQQQAQQVAAQFPKVSFVVVNGNASAAPNLSSAEYEWEESGFLAGIAAGLTTRTNKVGTISSIKIPPIEGLYYGFQQGVRQVNPQATTTNSYMGTNVPDTGLSANLTTAQASQGGDVVFTVATGADPGVFKAAGKEGILVVGYGTDERNLGPDATLTSSLVDYEGTMVKMADLFNRGELKPQVYTYGFRDDAFSLAPITNVDARTAAQIRETADQAISGKFTIEPLPADG